MEDNRCFHCFKLLMYEYDDRREEYITCEMYNTISKLLSFI